MGRHAGDRGRRRWGHRPTDETWEAFLTHLATMSAIEISKLPGMPSAVAFSKKRKRDPEFHSRAGVIMAARRPGNRGHIYSRQIWEACLASIAKIGIAHTALIAGMPSFKGIYMKFWRDKEFRRRVVSVRPDNRGVIGERLQSQLLEDVTYAAIRNSLPGHLDRLTKDDVAADMMLAVLEGQLQVADLKTRAPEYVRKHRKMFGTFGVVSLDAPLRADRSVTLLDRLSGDAQSYWEAA